VKEQLSDGLQRLLQSLWSLGSRWLNEVDAHLVAVQADWEMIGVRISVPIRSTLGLNYSGISRK